MSEQNGAGAAGSTPSSNGQSQPAPGAGNFSVPDGYVLAPKSEYETTRRQAEQYNGVRPYWEAGSKYGIKSADDFSRMEPWLKQIGTLEKRGVKADMLERMFSGEADQDLGREEKPNFDPEKFREEIRSEFRKESATKEWQDMTAKEKGYVDDALRDYFGDEEVDEMTKTTYRLAVERFLDQNRELYPKDHPLYDSHLKPHDESIAKKAAEYFKKLKADSAGSSMKAKADAAIAAKKKPLTPAGNGGQQGKPKNDQPNKAPRDQIDDMVEKAMS